eukprot:CAMPEP_0174962858 /NCGR_PEP_ID=MMETSP0004_2-20121128/5005_1 /TAXON_ID=420556 /ORGANISM="Ochromonas sp., Strain CCMP1393" /LENGTH=76 /DNA_ID=CAMNT_0016211413 /DNA_START=80 /DNA_END=310 /DNA_ORIENTATION=+
MKFGTQLVSPKFYAGHFQALVTSTRAEMAAGSIAPLFKGMVLVGVVGYTMEYSLVGRYHVLDKQKIVKDAMASHGH